MSEETYSVQIFLVVLQHIIIPPNNFLEKFEQETSASASSYVYIDVLYFPQMYYFPQLPPLFPPTG